MVHTKILIMEGLKQLHDEYDPIIRNPYYQGEMEKIPTFTMKQIAKKVQKTIPTILKWCHILKEENQIKMGFRRSHFANDSPTYQAYRVDATPVRLRYPTQSELNAEMEEIRKKYGDIV